MFIGYLDASDRNIKIEDQRNIIKKYASDSSFDIDVFMSGNDVASISFDDNSNSHTIVLSNILSLGNSLYLIKENLEMLMAKGVSIVSVQDGFNFKPETQTEQLIKGIGLSIDIRNSMMSLISKNTFEEKKLKGIKLGRAVGSKNKELICDSKYEEIKRSLKLGKTRNETAKLVGVSIATLYNFLRVHPELKVSSSSVGGN